MFFLVLLKILLILLKILFRSLCSVFDFYVLVEFVLNNFVVVFDDVGK